jgi:hypothetical protein
VGTADARHATRGITERGRDMTEYHVTWTIEVEADSALDAAEQALDIQRDPDSWAVVFEVRENTPTTTVDLRGEKG